MNLGCDILWRYSPSAVLKHYGVKGMKWGVRRTPEQLRYDKSSITGIVNKSLTKIATKNGILVRSISDHAANQAAQRKVSAKDIVDALKNSLYINDVIIDDSGRKSQRFIGYSATVNVNPDTGVIATVWKTGTRKRNKYLER